MKYIEEFRNAKLVRKAADKIQEIMPACAKTIMEVCGTHTYNFRKFGLGKILPDNLKFISGPGCPVCVAHEDYLDDAMKIAQDKNTIIATFGDMLRIPGTKGSLEKERAKGADIQTVYSPLDALKIAAVNSRKKVIFLAVGFETTAPAIALSIISAKKDKLKNISFLCSLKLMPPAMKYLLQDKRVSLDGFLCPGHVSTIIGTKPYKFIPRDYKIPCCIAGFEPLDILEGIFLILRQISVGKAVVDNQYKRVVKDNGNPKAKAIIAKVFTPGDAFWRGLGKIPGSGLRLKDKFAEFDAERIFSIKQRTEKRVQRTECRCGEVLKGLINPTGCRLFAKVCTPSNPKGPCMVSSEGVCNAYYKFR